MSHKVSRRLRVRESKMDEIAATQSIDAITNPHRLADALLEHGEQTETRAYTGFVRCSSLGDVCIREQYLGYKFGRTHSKRTKVHSKITFDLGSAVHKWMQNDPSYFGDSLIGYWRCLACGSVQFGRRPKTKCPHCQARKEAFEYKEHEMKMEHPLRLSGHNDLTLEVESGAYRIGEIKTISGSEFDKLSMPKADHVMQVHGYMIGYTYDKTFPVSVDTHKALLIYVSKRHQENKHPMKAFHVQRDPSVMKSVVSDLKEFMDAMTGDGGPPRPLTTCVASDFGVYRAKVCPVLKECKSLLVK